MKFSLPFYISEKGVFLVSQLDKLFHYSISFIRDTLYSLTFNNGIPDQNQISSSYKKLTGYGYNDIISQWIQYKYPHEHVIVLTNINVEAKNIQFWAKVPQTEIIHFLQDVVILRCKDNTEMQRLVENIPSNFADAVGYCAGTVVTYNQEDF